MILGIGTDLIQINRIEKILSKNIGIQFKYKILNKEELSVYSSKMSDQHCAKFLAKRFAAKEAISKALGIGIGKIAFHDITILNNALGQPYAKISKKACKAIYELKSIDHFDIHLSISDDYPSSIAFAIVVV
ncbi:MAG: holo-ACP synthase [Rickettsiaceae bacterium]